MVDINQARDNSLVSQARAALKARIKRQAPRFEVVYDGSRQRGVLRVTQPNSRREYPLPQGQQQTRITEY